MRVVGLMSGTSLDGIDAAVVDVDTQLLQRTVRLDTGTDDPSDVDSDPGEVPRHHIAQLVAFATVPYPPETLERIHGLLAGAFSPMKTLETVCSLNFEIGEAFAAAAQAVMADAAQDDDAPPVRLVCSHGQTLYHLPEGSDTGGVPSTLQLGDASVIAERLGCTVVADLRTADVAAGGTGAPLIPFVDRLLFSHATRCRVMLNLGGIANVSVLAPPSLLSAAAPNSVSAHDTGPANMVMDALCRLSDATEASFDAGGDMASQGTVHAGALGWALRHPYFAQQPPKCTGHEDFGQAFARDLAARIFDGDTAGLHTHQGLCDALATACALTVHSVVDAVVLSLCDAGITCADVIASGGGARNSHLMAQMAAYSAAQYPELGVEWTTLQALVDCPEFGDAKEALGFAVMGAASALGIPANVPEVTGASHKAVLGKFVCPHGVGVFPQLPPPSF